MEYPDYKTYELLYAKYLDINRTKQMVNMAIDRIGDISNKIFLDICCGNGRATSFALYSGFSNSFMVDLEPKMIPDFFRKDSRVVIWDGVIIDRFLKDVNYTFDVAFCQQGINYWLEVDSAELLHNKMNKNGVFIFNTFRKKPPAIQNPSIKSYEFNGNKYMEISWIDDYDKVYHFQIMNDGELAHHTEFLWLSENYLQQNVLPRFFNFEVVTSNNTDIYICTKKG